MQFYIKCSAFIRLASICNFFEPTTDAELRAQLNTVRLEIKDGKMLAVATNQKIAAVEFIGNVPPGQNGFAHVVLDPAIIAQCKAESFMDGYLFINTIPEIATAMAQTSSGWAFPGNACHWFDETPLHEWRSWAPDKVAKASKGIMWWNLYHVEALLASSPSGKVHFPQFIDIDQPIVIRDRADPNWVGMFVPNPVPYEDAIKTPAALPEWWE